MTSRRAQPSRTEHSLLPLRRPGPRYMWAGLIGISLIAILWWIGDKHQKTPLWKVDTDWHGSVNWVQPLWNAFAQVFAGAGQVLTNRDSGAPLSVRLACLTMLLVFFWALRKAMLASNAYRPGPMDVKPLIDATPEGTSKPQIEDLTARLRKHLSETDLYPPAALPAEPPAENFLDLVGDVSLEPWKLRTSLLNLFSRLRPKVAYRVTGVLHRTPHDRLRGHGVTVTITAFSTRGSCAHTAWESTWEEAVHEAGSWVMATILPVTRAVKKPPWQAWKGRTLPAELFAAYQKGRELSRERKFDEALHYFYKAERWDPTNLFLRTQVAEVQEKLGLHLDALETYHGALTLGRLNTDEEDRRLWVAPWALRRFTYLWHWRQRPGVLQARYRYAVALGTWETAAPEWCDGGEDENHSRRADARQEIRDALTPAFADRYWPAIVDNNAKSLPLSYEEDTKQWIRRQLHDKRERYVRLIFALACQQEMRRLAQDYTVASLFPRLRADKKALTRPALRINRDVWAPLRLAWAHNEPTDALRPTTAWLPPGGAVLLMPVLLSARNWFRGNKKALTPPTLHINRDVWAPLRLAWAHNEPTDALRPTTAWLPPGGAVLLMPTLLFLSARDWFRGYRAYVKWPANTMPWPPRDLEKRVKQARTLFVRESHRYWQDHYNAACVYAIAMNAPNMDGSRNRLACLAFRELEAAVRGAESGFVMLKRSWVLAEDPDLDELRKGAEDTRLARLEREVYPHPTPDRRHFKNPKPIDIEIAISNSQLLQHIAGVMEQVWHRRGSQSPVGVHDAINWFEDEKSVWEYMHRVAGSRARNWPDRERLLQKIHQIADPSLLVELPPRVPEFNDILDDDEEWRNPDCARERIAGFDKRLKLLNELVSPNRNTSPNDASPIKCSEMWLTTLKRSDATGVARIPLTAVQKISARYAAIWQALHDLVETSALKDRGPLQDKFMEPLWQLKDPRM